MTNERKAVIFIVLSAVCLLTSCSPQPEPQRPTLPTLPAELPTDYDTGKDYIFARSLFDSYRISGYRLGITLRMARLIAGQQKIVIADNSDVTFADIDEEVVKPDEDSVLFAIDYPDCECDKRVVLIFRYGRLKHIALIVQTCPPQYLKETVATAFLETYPEAILESNPDYVVYTYRHNKDTYTLFIASEEPEKSWTAVVSAENIMRSMEIEFDKAFYE